MRRWDLVPGIWEPMMGVLKILALKKKETTSPSCHLFAVASSFFRVDERMDLDSMRRIPTDGSHELHYSIQQENRITSR